MAQILVVDDSSFQRMMLGKLLREQGHEPILAENGSIGLERLEDSEPEAVLCDLVMPVLDGFQFLEALVQREITVPTLVISADIQESAKERCLALGAFGFLNKPVGDDDLIAVLGKMLTQESDQ